MSRATEEEKIFAENLDHLLAGQEILGDASLSQELRTSLDFARRMAALRASPSARFQANLKARLLQQLDAAEARRESRQGWFWRLVPKEPVWQAIAIIAIVIVVGAALWGTLLRSSQPNNIANIPAPTAIVTAPVTLAAPAPATSAAAAPAPAASSAPASSHPPAGTTAAPTIVANHILTASAFTNKYQYSSTERVDITVTWQNVTSQPLTIREFPPIVSLMQSSNKQPVYTFKAGTSSRTLAPGEKADFVLTWDQTDDSGKHVAPGSYYVELEEMYYQGKEIPMNLSHPVSFEILS